MTEVRLPGPFTSPKQGDLFAHVALAQIPQILTLQDRNPHSRTYGCFDRNFWHYKIIDFPSGRVQEYVYALALAYSTDLPGNIFFKKPAIREWVAAGIRYAIKSSHHDGSCDDYYPYERASGAAAFSLLGFLESYVLMEFEDPEMLGFFRKRADFLAKNLESGRVTNHQALAILCLALATRLLRTDRWEVAIDERLKLILAWQDEEGWFTEYDGFDPGYQTLTISCLARFHEMRPSDYLANSLARAVRLMIHFVHPDGSFGGEYGSRNTYNFFPHGFELAGKWMPEALWINNCFLDGMAKGLQAFPSDDHVIGTHTWNYLLAWKDFIENRPPLEVGAPGRLWLKNAGILIDQRQRSKLYLALNKGGTFKFFRDGKLVLSDTQFSLIIEEGGHRRNAVGHLVGNSRFEIRDNEILLQGSLGWAKDKMMTSFNLIILRICMLTFGRFFPDLARRILQNLLITGKKAAPFIFHRSIRWNNDHLIIHDELKADSWEFVSKAGIGGSQTSIYVVMSRVFQCGQLQPWMDLTDNVKTLHPGESLIVERLL